MQASRLDGNNHMPVSYLKQESCKASSVLENADIWSQKKHNSFLLSSDKQDYTKKKERDFVYG